MRHLTDLLLVIAMGIIVFGLAKISTAAALIIGGCLLFVTVVTVRAARILEKRVKP